MNRRPIDPRALLLGILALLRREGIPATRTRLMKYLYLADLQNARYQNGETATGWTWRVDRFGPLAVEGLRLLDRGEREGWLRTWRIDSDDEEGGQKAVGYDPVGSIDALLADFPPSIAGQLRAWMKQYGSSTNRLLRFVYGDTEPMQTAREGETLDFTRATKPSVEQPIPDKPITARRRKRMDEVMQRIRAKYEVTRAASARIADGPYDDEYRRGLPVDEPLDAGEVTLTFPPPPDPEHGPN